MRIDRGKRSTRRKPTPMLLCPPKISHDMIWDRTRAAAVGSWHRRSYGHTSWRSEVSQSVTYRFVFWIHPPWITARITLNWISGKYSLRIWTVSKWLRIRFCEYGSEPMLWFASLWRLGFMLLHFQTFRGVLLRENENKSVCNCLTWESGERGQRVTRNSLHSYCVCPQQQFTDRWYELHGF
jgi:hypothetical protein